jgi:hypothetical protein
MVPAQCQRVPKSNVSLRHAQASRPGRQALGTQNQWIETDPAGMQLWPSTAPPLHADNVCRDGTRRRSGARDGDGDLKRLKGCRKEGGCFICSYAYIRLKYGLRACIAVKNVGSAL